MFEGKDIRDTYALWSFNEERLVDTLELLSGLSVFANDSFDKKLRFLFDVFDFNDSGCLQTLELELMVCYIVSAAFKVFSINQPILREEVSRFVQKGFEGLYQVNIS